MELNLDQILQSERAWEYVLLDIVRSENLDPWDIDISRLTAKYTERINQMKEFDLKVPARLLLAAAILLRMKSDRLVDSEEREAYAELLRGDEEFLFGDDDEESGPSEEVPLLTLITKRKHLRKITLEDLIGKLEVSMRPKERKVKVEPFVLVFDEVDITEQIEELYTKIMESKKDKIPFDDLLPSKTREDMINTLMPLLHLANDSKVKLVQEKLFEDLYVLSEKN
ncbi:TPA: segregation/condensation protein A [archaeon]|uniref:Segregation/condensation protein A n=1 Tax=Candidatus Undinarchaeum marinum TaxID=2756141 RepID=A0A832V089_9ARCH|nr:segregation/condensation protein A [Candidatus Undinarchaeum marinum]